MPIDQPPTLPDPLLFGTGSTYSSTITSNRAAFIVVAEDGTVTIDWDNVQKTADQSEHTEWWGIARALLKARSECRGHQ